MPIIDFFICEPTENGLAVWWKAQSVEINPVETALQLHEKICTKRGCDATRLALWQPNDSLFSSEHGRSRLVNLLDEHGDELSKFATDLQPRFSLRLSQLFDFEPGARITALIAVVYPSTVRARKRPAEREGEQGLAGERKRFKLLESQTNRKPPSIMGKEISQYAAYQKGPTPIYDGRNLTTCGLPIEAMHPAFASFKANASDQSIAVPEDAVRATAELMTHMSHMRDEKETDYRPTTRAILSGILNQPVTQTRNTNNTAADHLVITLAETKVAALGLGEEKNDIGSGGDAVRQAAFSYLEFWHDPTRRDVRLTCFCPSFLFAICGPWLCIMGAVYLSSPVVQPLTDYIWIGEGHNLQFRSDHVVRVARVLLALRNGLKQLGEFYQSLALPVSASLSNKRFFSLACSFPNANGQVVRFCYEEMLKTNSSASSIFLAVDSNDSNRKYVIKFTERYGADVHRLLSQKKLAPDLLYHGPIWFDDQVARRGCGNLVMVVMDFVEKISAEDVPLNIFESIHKDMDNVLELLDQHGYVHGDLRRPNVVFQKPDGKVKVVDFDWSGEDGKVRYPLYLTKELTWLKGDDGVRDYGLIYRSHDKAMAKKWMDEWK